MNNHEDKKLSTEHQVLWKRAEDVEQNSEVSTSQIINRLGLKRNETFTRKTTEELVADLHDQDWNIRVTLVQALGQQGENANPEFLMEALGDSHASVRVAAICASSAVKNDLLRVRVVEMLQTDPDWQVRETAVRVLGSLGEQAPLDVLLAALDDVDASVRATVVYSLSLQGTRVPINKLTAALQDASWLVRETAALTLGMLGDVAVVPLIAALEDSDLMVRDAAAMALRETTLVVFPQGVELTNDIVPEQMPLSLPVREIQLNSSDVLALLSPDGPREAVQFVLQRSIVHLWLVFSRQLRLMHTSIWIITALVIVLSCVFAMYMSVVAPALAHGAELALAIMTMVVSGAGTAFLCGSEHDPGREVVFATPTPIGIVLGCRVVALVGYNVLFALLASLCLALVNGSDFGQLVQLWLGPLLLLSSLSLLLSLVLSYAFAVMGVLLLETLHIIQARFIGGLVVLPQDYFWNTSPPTLLLALVVLILALIYATRYPRLA